MFTFSNDADPPYETFTTPPVTWVLTTLQQQDEIDKFFDWLFARGQPYLGARVSSKILEWSFDRFIKNVCLAIKQVFLYLTLCGQQVNRYWLDLAETLTFVRYEVV